MSTLLTSSHPTSIHWAPILASCLFLEQTNFHSRNILGQLPMSGIIFPQLLMWLTPHPDHITNATLFWSLSLSILTKSASLSYSVPPSCYFFLCSTYYNLLLSTSSFTVPIFTRVESLSVLFTVMSAETNQSINLLN